MKLIILSNNLTDIEDFSDQLEFCFRHLTRVDKQNRFMIAFLLLRYYLKNYYLANLLKFQKRLETLKMLTA